VSYSIKAPEVDFFRYLGTWLTHDLGRQRSPLALIVGQVFLELSNELENQGLTKKAANPST
jgi:hypothetical protein